MQPEIIDSINHHTFPENYPEPLDGAPGFSAIARWSNNRLADARTWQIGFLTMFLILGVATRDWAIQPGLVVVAIATCTLTQWLCSHATRNLAFWQSPPDGSTPPHPASTLPSAIITALGLSLLLRTDHFSTMVLASLVAIASKFLLRVQGKHLFNPANFGIIAALTLTHDAWVSPGQWGEESWYALLFLSAGGLILERVGRWDTTVAFLGTYAGLEAIRTIWLGWTWDVWAHRLMSGSLLLFALFMITDPRTIPNARMGRMVWAIAIALLTFVLRNAFFVSTAAFWALFALAPLSLLLDRLLPASRFEWNGRSPSQYPPT